jgi:hypothetical protein
VAEGELFLAAVDALNRGDVARMNGILDPEFRFHPIRAGMTGDYLGLEGIEQFLADNAETFDRFHAEYDDIRVLDDGRLFGSGTVRIRGRGSQVDTFVVSAGIATFRDGLCTGWHDYGDRDAALAAAVLSE